MSTTELNDIPECLREKLVVNAQSEEQYELKRDRSRNNSEYLETYVDAEKFSDTADKRSAESSDYSGESDYVRASGVAGTSDYAGASGVAGTSDYEGAPDYAGTSGVAGTPDYARTSDEAEASNVSGVSNATEATNAAGVSNATGATNATGVPDAAETSNVVEKPYVAETQMDEDATVVADAGSVADASGEAVEAMTHSCRGGNCMRPEPPCRGGNCMRPEPPCRGGNCWRPPFPNYPYHTCPMGGMCRKPDRPPFPVPYYQAHPGMLRLQENSGDEIDMEKMKERYPRTARRIQEHVEEAADRMDYDGSMMFDEYPDQVRIDRIVNEIYDDVFTNNPDDELGENCDCSEKNEIIKELITVILFQQMYFRRCRNRKCEEWW